MLIDLMSGLLSPYSSIGDKGVIVLILLLLLVIVGLTGVLVFSFVDSVLLVVINLKTTLTVITKKEVVPADSTFILAGNAMIPQHRSKSYWIYFKIHGKEVDYMVEKKFFDQINVGDSIEVNYGFGKLSKTCYALEVKLAGK